MIPHYGSFWSAIIRIATDAHAAPMASAAAQQAIVVCRLAIDHAALWPAVLTGMTEDAFPRHYAGFQLANDDQALPAAA